MNPLVIEESFELNAVSLIPTETRISPPETHSFLPHPQEVEHIMSVMSPVHL